MVLNLYVYVAILIFLVATIYRVVRVASTPVHLRWELYPVPHEGGKKAKYGGSYFEETDWWTKARHSSMISELRVMIPEILFLKAVWEHNRSLWFWSWGFHFGLYLAVGVAGLSVVSALLGATTALGQIIVTIAGFMALGGYALGALGCVGLMIKRLVDPKLKDYTPVSAHFNLLFILAIFVSGLVTLITGTEAGYVGEVQGILTGLVTFTPIATSGMMMAHVAITVTFMLYMPLTHMAHFVLKYFTYHSIRWNDEPMEAGSDLEKKINHSLGLKPTWAAAHLRMDGKKTWVDVATEEVFKDE